MKEKPAGLLLIDKSRGPTSHDVVGAVRRLLRTREVGHTGTLDPMATGLLPVCFGAATRLVPYLTETDKGYTGVLQLGAETDTDDVEGRVMHEGDASALSDGDIAAAFELVRLRKTQVPPQFSAIRIDGERAHAMARAGKEFVLPERDVEVPVFHVTGRDGSAVSFAAEVSKGTYIRSLGRDVGRELGCFGHLTGLRRTRVGRFVEAQSATIAALTESGVEGAVLSMWEAVCLMPEAVVDADGRRRLLLGQAVPAECAAGDGEMVRIANESGDLLALATWRSETGTISPKRVFGVIRG